MMATNSSTTGSEAMMGLERVCIQFPPKVSSPGLATLMLDHRKEDHLLQYSGPRLHLQMFITFVLTQLIHNLLLKHVGLPIFISQILAGIVLGPTVFKNHQHSLITMSNDSVRILGTLASMGYMTFLFLSAVKMDLSMAYKAGRKAICIGVLTVLVPVVFSLTTDLMMGDKNLIQNKSLFLSITYSATSFPVIHGLLTDLKIMNSELGRLGLSAALVSDLVSLALINIGQWVKNVEANGVKSVLEEMGFTVAFVAVVFLVLRPVMKWMVRRTPEGGQIKDSFVYAVILAFMMSLKITSVLRMFILLGPFILGLAVPDGPPLGSALVERLDPIVSGLFLPLFASTCGMRIDLFQLQNSSKYAKHQAIAAVVTLIVKFLVCSLLPLVCKMPTRDSLALGFIMISKGIVEMASYSVLLDKGIISEDLLAIMSIIIILLASIVPLLVRRLYDPSRKYISYKKRSILHSKPNEDLRMMGCIHVPGNVNSIIKLLNSSRPTKESPIELDVLHLVKLSGRATPLFVAHQQHGSYYSYSENIVLAFSQFERDNWGAVSVNVFTAVSPQNLMHEDICNLAMDKLTSFIIVPFHRRWCIDGTIESEDQAIRSLNCTILDRAPCSLGILVDGHRKHSNSINTFSSDDSPFRIAVIFLGGKDDREALALAKRISPDKKVSLTVIHIKAARHSDTILADQVSDTMLDNEMLRIMKETAGVTYIEHQVNDGPETSSFLRSMLNDYKLAIVGRRFKMEDPQTLGLEEWSEFPEIGIIGDLLASPDFGGNYSVLIVQQQQLGIA